MNTVGIFAGRGDVILAMGLSVLVGVWIGWQAKRFQVWVRSRRLMGVFGQ